LGYKANGTLSNPTNDPTLFTLPPQPPSLSTIADALTTKGVTWKYYSGGRGTDGSAPRRLLRHLGSADRLYKNHDDPSQSKPAVRQDPLCRHRCRDRPISGFRAPVGAIGWASGQRRSRAL